MSVFGMNRSDAELMQYLKPVGGGPSGKRCPRWESPNLLRTSVRTMNRDRSAFSTMKLGSNGRVKLGQPVPESNLSV